MKYKYRTGLRLKRKDGELHCRLCNRQIDEDRNNPLISKKFCGKCYVKPYIIMKSRGDGELYFLTKNGKEVDSFLFKFRYWIWLLRNRKKEERFFYDGFYFEPESMRRIFRNGLNEGVFYVKVDRYGNPVLNRDALIVYEIRYI